MIRKTRNRLFFRWMAAFMGVVFLNGIVDPPDIYSDAVAEDLSYNEMESVLEVLMECVLQFEDFFEEYDDDDTGKMVLKKRLSLDPFLFPEPLPDMTGGFSYRDKSFSMPSCFPKDIWQDPLTPPPDLLS